MDGGGRKLRVVMVPWVAMGHLLPFMEISKRLAAKGHRISFLSTPRNIERLRPSIPPRFLTPPASIDLVEVSLQRDVVDGKLPDSVEATVDLPSEDVRPYLTAAYNSAFERELSAFLRRTNREADWIVYDFPAHWVPSVATSHGVPCALLCLFGAAAMSFYGPLSGDNGKRPKSMAEMVEKLTTVPDWVPFPTTVALRRHEARQVISMHKADAAKDDEPSPWGASIERCQFVAIRSCVELEPEWLKLLGDLYRKPVMPLGLFPPSSVGEDGIDLFQEKTWATTFEWLDKQATRSVVYAAFGSEVKLSSRQVQAIGLGLEQSGLPFVWALPAGSAELPEGFDGRTEGQGVICKGWVPQARFLAHPSVGGFLTHGGWNSVVEGMSNGVVLLLLPLILDQGLNARSLVEKGIGVEVARDEDDDGAFTGDGIARGLRLVMVEAEGERFRAKAAELKEVLGDEEKHDRCLEEFVDYLWDHRRQQVSTTLA